MCLTDFSITFKFLQSDTIRKRCSQEVVTNKIVQNASKLRTEEKSVTKRINSVQMSSIARGQLLPRQQILI